MFGFLKKLFRRSEKPLTNKPKERRKHQRRQKHSDRRDAIRWEPDKTDRRSGKDRRKNTGTWDGHDQ